MKSDEKTLIEENFRGIFPLNEQGFPRPETIPREIKKSSTSYALIHLFDILLGVGTCQPFTTMLMNV